MKQFKEWCNSLFVALGAFLIILVVAGRVHLRTFEKAKSDSEYLDKMEKKYQKPIEMDVVHIPELGIRAMTATNLIMAVGGTPTITYNTDVRYVENVVYHGDVEFNKEAVIRTKYEPTVSESNGWYVIRLEDPEKSRIEPISQYGITNVNEDLMLIGIKEMQRMIQKYPETKFSGLPDYDKIEWQYHNPK